MADTIFAPFRNEPIKSISDLIISNAQTLHTSSLSRSLPGIVDVNPFAAGPIPKPGHRSIRCGLAAISLVGLYHARAGLKGDPPVILPKILQVVAGAMYGTEQWLTGSAEHLSTVLAQAELIYTRSPGFDGADTFQVRLLFLSDFLSPDFFALSLPSHLLRVNLNLTYVGSCDEQRKLLSAVKRSPMIVVVKAW